ncbi:hypothetical protein MGN70_002744 [Eutypa lata]|nr:hypothetical protein MGN70_002744 [Eutypa lata]
MLDDYRIPFKTWHENGRHAHAFDDYSHIGTSECPTSLAPDIRSPSGEDVVSDVKDRIWSHRRSVQACPLSLLYILCEELGYRNEARGRALIGEYDDMEKEVGKVCVQAQQSSHPKADGFYKYHAKAIHDLNTLHFRLGNLGYATEFEQSSLAFVNSVLVEYQRMRAELSLPEHPPTQRELYRRQTQNLENAALVRRARQIHTQQKLERYVSLVSNSRAAVIVVIVSRGINHLDLI